MLLVMDIGNTNIVLGLFDKDRMLCQWRSETKRNRTADEYGIFFLSMFASRNVALKDVHGIIVSSVVPPLNSTMEQLCRKYFDQEPFWVGPGIKTGIPVKYDNPKEVGADRIVNAVAAYNKWKQAMIVVDFGTATTFDCISAKGEYLGGAITPGPQISAEALFQRAAKLPRVDFSAPKKVIGKNTTDSMRAGIVYGYSALVEGMIERIRKEMGGSVKVIATGGFAHIIREYTQSIEVVDEFLTLDGLRLLYELNQR